MTQKWQPEFGHELNLASTLTLGCGMGTIFHFSCGVAGMFREDFSIVKNRVKGFFSDLSISVKSAFGWYFDDIKENGVAFWIEFAVVLANFAVFLLSLLKAIELLGNM